jgi:hypothetical protein
MLDDMPLKFVDIIEINLYLRILIFQFHLYVKGIQETFC